MSKRKPEIILIDGRNWAYRNGFTRSTLFSKKRPTGVLFGCIWSLIRLNRLFPDAAIVVCWDGKDASKSWRHKLCPRYKSNRVTDKTKEVAPEVLHIRSQIPILEKFLANYGLAQFSVPELEADDLIGVLATALKRKHSKVIIYSTDRDFYQLIRGNVVVVRDIDKSKKGLEITAKEIKKEYGVTPKDWLKYRAFVGDAGDRIDKPIKGIGPQKALKILASGVDASRCKSHPDFKKNWKAIRLAYRLSKIIRTPEDKHLPEDIGRMLSENIRFGCRQLFRDPSKKTKKRYKKMIAFLGDYDLEQLMENRHILWAIK